MPLFQKSHKQALTNLLGFTNVEYIDILRNKLYLLEF